MADQTIPRLPLREEKAINESIQDHARWWRVVISLAVIVGVGVVIQARHLFGEWLIAQQEGLT
jgi:hypothetical protein